MTTLKIFTQTLRLKARGIDEVVFNVIKDFVAKRVVKDVKQRVIDRGVDAQGNSFSPYSKDWEKKRKKEGLGSTKNFEFTGSMWDRFGIVKEEKKAASIEVWLGMSGQNSDTRKTNQELVNYHSNNEGRPIIELSDSEAEELNKEIKKQLKLYLNVA